MQNRMSNVVKTKNIINPLLQDCLNEINENVREINELYDEFKEYFDSENDSSAMDTKELLLIYLREVMNDVKFIELSLRYGKYYFEVEE